MSMIHLAIIGLICGLTNDVGQTPEPKDRATFRAGVDLVAMTAVVKDRSGRSVQGLSPADFELFDAGERRPILHFSAEPAPASVAIVLDISGSMAVGAKLSAARDAMGHVVSWLDSGKDEIAIFTFDSSLREEQAFSPAKPGVTSQLSPLKAFGSTSLYDAIAHVGQRVAARPFARRVIVVVTDGVDTSSTRTAAEVSRFASAIDVPVYVVAIETAVDGPVEAPPARGGKPEAADGPPLEAIAGRTGGLFFLVSAPAHASLAARQIAAELHSWYQLAFEPGRQSGWHGLTLRTRRKGLLVRTRSGYVARDSSPEPHTSSER